MAHPSALLMPPAPHKQHQKCLFVSSFTCSWGFASNQDSFTTGSSVPAPEVLPKSSPCASTSQALSFHTANGML